MQQRTSPRFSVHLLSAGAALAALAACAELPSDAPPPSPTGDIGRAGPLTLAVGHTRIAAEGSAWLDADLTQVAVTPALDVDLSVVDQTFDLQFDVAVDASTTLRAHASGTAAFGYETVIPGARVDIPLLAAPLPLVATIELVAGWQGSVAGAMDAELPLEIHGSVQGHAWYDAQQGWRWTLNGSRASAPTLDAHVTTSPDATAALKVFVKPKLTIGPPGIGGVWLDLEPALVLRRQDGATTASVTASSSLGLSFSLFDVFAQRSSVRYRLATLFSRTLWSTVVSPPAPAEHTRSVTCLAATGCRVYTGHAPVAGGVVLGVVPRGTRMGVFARFGRHWIVSYPMTDRDGQVQYVEVDSSRWEASPTGVGGTPPAADGINRYELVCTAASCPLWAGLTSDDVAGPAWASVPHCRRLGVMIGDGHGANAVSFPMPDRDGRVQLANVAPGSTTWTVVDRHSGVAAVPGC